MGINVASKKALDGAISIYEWINDIFKSFGIVAGWLAASAADWVFGSVTMATLLSNYGFPNSWTKWVIGAVFSLALWGIQIILWQMILSGKVGKVFASKGWVM